MMAPASPSVQSTLLTPLADLAANCAACRPRGRWLAVKLRVLARRLALCSIRDRIRAVALKPFFDEQGREHRFTWRTIETWRVR